RRGVFKSQWFALLVFLGSGSLEQSAALLPACAGV
ncbi:hypothetical protein L195_g064230, partial [Trifolium pratense]